MGVGGWPTFFVGIYRISRSGGTRSKIAVLAGMRAALSHRVEITGRARSNHVKENSQGARRCDAQPRKRSSTPYPQSRSLRSPSRTHTSGRSNVFLQKTLYSYVSYWWCASVQKRASAFSSLVNSYFVEKYIRQHNMPRDTASWRPFFRETLEDSFSAVSPPIFTNACCLFNIVRDLHVLHTLASL